MRVKGGQPGKHDYDAAAADDSSINDDDDDISINDDDNYQGVEQSTANILYFSLAEKLYPESGYFSETGGYLANLRNSTNIRKVREYHKKFYR